MKGAGEWEEEGESRGREGCREQGEWKAWGGGESRFCAFKVG